MTRPELHELVDIVMDAREKMPDEDIQIEIEKDMNIRHFINGYITKGFYQYKYKTFSDFTKAVQEYIKTLEQ